MTLLNMVTYTFEACQLFELFRSANNWLDTKSSFDSKQKTRQRFIEKMLGLCTLHYWNRKSNSQQRCSNIAVGETAESFHVECSSLESSNVFIFDSAVFWLKNNL